VVNPRTLLIAVRRASGLSQKALASRGHTSGPTIAAYESGSKEPRLSTLARLVESAGFRLRLGVEPLVVPERRAERRSLALHSRVFDHLLDDPERVRSMATRNLTTMRAANPDAERWLDEWELLLAGPTHELAAALISAGEHAQALRQSSPFAGVLSPQERLEALRPAR
jgi:transcriptional regulator with XRE-family HTH domain